MGELGYNSTSTYPRHKVEVNGELHAPVSLSPGKEPPVLIGQEAEWSTEPVWTLRRAKCLPVLGIEPRFHGLPVIGLVTIPSGLSRLVVIDLQGG
jgi:hypothetical protein